MPSNAAFEDPDTAEAFPTISALEWPHVYPKMDYKQPRTVEGLPTNCAIVAVCEPVVVLEKLFHCCDGIFLLAFLDRGFFYHAWVVFNHHLWIIFNHCFMWD